MPRPGLTTTMVMQDSSSLSSITYDQASGLARNVHIPYINIQFGSISLTWRGDENRPDYFTSLTHKRVKEKASEMTVNITYAPQYGEDPNKIEAEIVKSAGMCLVQYGDLASGVVRPYMCMVTDYTVNIDSGVLSYSFSMTSAAVSYNLVPFKANPEKLVGSESTIDRVIEVMKEAASKVKDHYVFEDPTEVLSSAKKFETFDFGGEEMSPIKFLIRTVSKIPCQNSNCLFSLSIDDNVLLGSKGKLRVVKIDTSKVQIVKTFNWGTRDGTVLGWSPNFKGAEWITASRSEKFLSSGDASIVSQIDPRTGKIITATKDLKGLLDCKSADPTVMVNNLITSLNDFSEKCNYCYEGDLTVLGESQPVYLGETVISINPLINGKSHISSGNYIVNGVTDTVDGSQGFITKYRVMRRGSDSNSGLYSGNNSFKVENSDVLWVNGSFIPYDQYSPEGLG